MIIVLLTGLLMAFSFQLVLTNFGVILGLLIPDVLGAVSQPFSKPETDSASESKPEEASSEPPLGAISALAGFGILLSVNLTLLPASFLAVKLGQINRPELGAIQGLVLWAAYFLLLTWLSSLALNSLLETVTGGIRRLWSGIAAGFRQADVPSSKAIPKQVEASVQAVLEDFDLEQQVQAYLDRVQPAAPHADWLQEKLANQLAQPALKSAVGQRLLQQMNQQTVTTWLQAHTDWPDSEAQDLTDQIAQLWEILRNHSGQGNLVIQFIDALDTAQPALAGQCDRPEASAVTEPEVIEVVSEMEGLPRSPSSPLKAGLSSLMEQIDAKAVLQELLLRADLSDWKVMDLWRKFQQFTGSAEPLAIMPAEVEHYLLTMPVWNLTPTAIAEDFPELLYDPDAHPVEMQRQLQALNRDRIQQILTQRKADLEAETKIEAETELADQIEVIRQQVLAKVEQAIQGQQQSMETSGQGAIAQILPKLKSYLKYTNLDKLTGEGIERKLQTLMEEAELSAERSQHTPTLDQVALTGVLRHRQGLSAQKRDQIVAQLQSTWTDHFPPPLRCASKPSISEQLTQALREVLSVNQADQLDLEDLKPYVLRTLQQSQLEWPDLAEELKTLDWTPLTAVLAEYKLQDQQINALIDWSQQRFYQMARLPRRWLSRSRRQPRQLTVQLQRYLQHQPKAALTPERIQSNLEQMVQPLLDLAQTVGDSSKDFPEDSPEDSLSSAWPDRDQVLHWLSERGDLATDEIEQISDRLSTAWDQARQQSQETYHQASQAVESLMSQFVESVQSVSLPALDLPDFLHPLQTRLEQLAHTLPSSMSDASLGVLANQLKTWQQDLSHSLTHLSEGLSDDISQTIQAQAMAVQTQISQQIAQLEQQTLRQINQIRRVAIAAAAWLFCIAVSSAVMSALAGFIAVQGVSWFPTWLSQMGR